VRTVPDIYVECTWLDSLACTYVITWF